MGKDVFICGKEIYTDENEYWHRENGPAYITEELQTWWKHGKRHRIDGPAVDSNNGYKEWWVNGKKLDCTTQEEFELLMKLDLFW